MNNKKKNYKKYEDGSLVDGPPNKTATSVKAFYNNYLNSPKYKERLQGQGYKDPNLVISDRLFNVNRANIGITNSKPGPNYVGSNYNFGANTITIDNADKKYYKINDDDLYSHEFSHAAGAIATPYPSPYTMNFQDQKLINSKNKFYGYKNNNKIITLEQAEKLHNAQSDELKADLDNLRYKLYNDKIYNTGTQDFNQDLLNKAKSKYTGDGNFDRLKSRLSDQDLILLMNKVAVNKPQNGIPQAEFGDLVEENGPPTKRPVMQKDNTKIVPQNIKPFNQEQYDYYHPSIIPGITSGDKTVDYIYNHPGLINTPIIGNMIKDKAYNVAKNSGGNITVDNVSEKSGSYKGDSYINTKSSVNLVDQYFGEGKSLPKSTYQPTSDYLNFLPSYSIKGSFDTAHKNGYNMSNMLKDILHPQTEKRSIEDDDAIQDKPLNDKELNYSKPIYTRRDYNSLVSNELGVDLQGHKLGISMDKERNLPYISISDAWDFEPKNYSKKDADFGKKYQDKAYIQASLMQQTGKPFKIYDRLYFDPKTKQYIPDNKLPQINKPNSPIVGTSGPVDKFFPNNQPKMEEGGNIMIGQNIKNKKLKKYADGYFVDDISGQDGTSVQTPNKFGQFINSKQGGSTINTVAQYGAAAVDQFKPVNGDSSAGLGAASGALSGAGTGAAIGSVIPGIGTVIGGAAGAVIGGTAGFISGGAKHRKYKQQQEQATSDNYFNTRDNMTNVNVDPYGNQMAFGGTVPLDDPKAKLKAKQIAKQQPTYDPSLLNPGLDHFMTSPNGQLKYWGNDIVPQPEVTPIVPQVLSDKALGYSNTYYPSRGQQQSKTPDVIPSNRFEDGSDIHIKPSHRGRFTAYKERTGKTTEEALHSSDPHVRQMANFAKNAASWKHEYGDTVQDTNTQQNQINIQKGELLIDPNTGKILQDYKGINPLTGGLFEPHAKDKQSESPNNFTMADPGLFVITKKTSKQYKDAIDNNDKISQQTVLMNIRNAKIQKEGGLKPKNYAYGDTVRGEYIDPGQTSAFVPSSITAPQGNPVNVDPYLNHQQILNYQTSYPDAPPSGFATGLNELSKYGPSLLNIGQGLFGKVNTQPQGRNISNPYLNNIIGNMPTDIRGDSIVNEAYSTANSAVKDVANNTNNAGVYRANRQNILSNTQKNIAGIRENIARENSGIKTQRAGIYSQLGAQDIAQKENLRNYNYGVTQNNNQAQAARQNLLNTGISQLQQTQMNDKTNATRARLDQYQIDLLKQIYPSINPYDFMSSGYVNKIKQG